LWHRLGFGGSLRRVLRNGRSSFDCERLLRVMVFNRLCDLSSKLGVTHPRGVQRAQYRVEP
jgi:hypothetical protein